MQADAENRIEEVKEDFGVACFNVQEFYATEATLNFEMMAYNLMSLFWQVILRQHSVQPQLKTFRYKVISIGSFITKHGNDHILKLALVMQRRYLLLGYGQRHNRFDGRSLSPLIIPNDNSGIC